MDIHPSNVIPIDRPTARTGPGRGCSPSTIVYAVSDDDGLVEVASVVSALDARAAFRQVVVHTGSESSEGMLDGVDGARVDRWLRISAGSHAERTAAALTSFEAVLLETAPEVVVVAGDHDAAVGASLAAAKLEIAVAHIGAGLRSWDWTVPEEINRSVVDRLSDTLFTSTPENEANLLGEGVPDGRIHAVGNTRIDVLRRYQERARHRAAWWPHGAIEGGYILVLLCGAQTPERLTQIANALQGPATAGPVLFLAHPAIEATLRGPAVTGAFASSNVTCVGPLCYLDRLSLQVGAGALVTDCGAYQEEATALGVPCYSLQSTASQSGTLTHGTNVLLGDDPAVLTSVRPSNSAPTPAAIPLWDGRAGERIADTLIANYALSASVEGEC